MIRRMIATGINRKTRAYLVFETKKFIKSLKLYSLYDKINNFLLIKVMLKKNAR